MAQKIAAFSITAMLAAGISPSMALIIAAQAALQRGADKEILAETLDRTYATKIPDDATLIQAFETHYKSSPGSYAPVAEEG